MGRKFTVAEPDYKPPKHSPPAFKKLVKMMQAGYTLREIEQKTGEDFFHLRRYVTAFSGFGDLTPEQIQQIETKINNL